MPRHALPSAVGLMLLASSVVACDGPSSSGGRGGAAGSSLGGGGKDALGRGTGGAGRDGNGGGGAGGLGGTPPIGGTAGAHAGPGGAGGIHAGAGLPLDGAPIYTRVQRLTKDQWQRAVADILRLDAPAPALQAPAPSPLGGADFANNEKLLVVDMTAELDFESASEAAAARATASAEALARVYAGTDAAGFVRTLGRRAFRRPLTADEEQSYQAIFAVGQSLYGAGFANGASLVIRAMLASPKFLYRSELGPSGEPLSGYEVAAKLSFWLLGTTPSDDLLDMAAAGGLDAATGVETAARAMLERPEAAAMMRDFHGQLYQLDRLAQLDPARVAAGLGAELAEASSRFFDAIFTRGEPLRSIFTSTRVFVGPASAATYGLDPPPAGIEERTLDPSRAGYFTQVPFLLVNGASNGESDPIARGIALSNEVLCVAVPSDTKLPPALPALQPGQTNRQRIEAATAGCGDCHTSLINPLGFAFEGFDGLGRARTLDNGAAVDTMATYTFAAGPRTFADARGLMDVLADSGDAQGCYAKSLAGYALQRDMAEGDRAAIQDLATSARDRSLKEVIVALARHPAFRLRAEGGP